MAEKGILQAYERRLKVWHPTRAAVLGAGTIGLLATMALRCRGLDVTTFGLDEPPSLNSELVEAIGAGYVSTKQVSLADAAAQSGKFDLVFEATAYSPIIFEAMHDMLAKNGVMVLASVTGGNRRVEIAADQINLDFVLGNKAVVGTVNANREHLEAGVQDLVRAHADWPGWLARLLTHRIEGLPGCAAAFELLGAPGTIKVYVNVTSADIAE